MNRICTILLLLLALVTAAHAQPTKAGRKKNTTKVKAIANKIPPSLDTTGMAEILALLSDTTLQESKEFARQMALLSDTSTQEFKDFARRLAFLSDTTSQAFKDYVQQMDSLMKALQKKSNHPRTSNTPHAAKQNQAIPLQPLGWVNDFTDLFTLPQQTELDSLITAFEKTTTVEIAIVTIDSADTNKAGFDKYVLDLHNRWGVGKKEKNNGIVIGICPGFKRIRISTGRGIMAQLTDEEAKSIIDNIIVPQYRQGGYFEGTKLGLLAVIQELKPTN
jgi:uncharacterized protein